MLFTAAKSDPSKHGSTVPDVGRPESVFAPTAELQADVDAGRCGWRQLERRYTEAMRARYRADPQVWVELAEQAAAEDVTLVGEARGPDGDESRVRCHRRILYDLLCAVAKDVGVWVDPDMEEIDRSVLEMRRKEVMRERGFPLTCPVCSRPAGTALAIRGRDGYGYCSQACLDADLARWKAQLQAPGNGRRP